MTYPLRFLVLTGLALALSACGGSDQETAPPPEPEQTVETAPAPQRAEPADPPPPALEADPAAEDDALARGLEGDADRLAELQTSIGQVREQMEAAESGWQETVRVTLSPIQLEQLEEWLGAPP